MIKSIVEKVMIKEFSKYINGIEYNKLTIEVLGGHFSIENISLNHLFFNSLETPLLVAYSHIGKLSIDAPLTKLSSVPVSCVIEDVFVILQLKKHANLSSEATKQQLLNKYVKDTFQLLVSKMKDVNKEEGMFDKLGKKIVDNLKFQVKNIHVRVEQSNQLYSYSFGVSLKSLNFGTTDSKWQPVFIEREKQKGDESIFKLMIVQNFKIYWQSLGNKESPYLFLRQQDPKKRIESMKRYICIDDDAFLSVNCKVHMMINPSSAHKLPLIELDIKLDPINIKFSKQKIVQVLDFTTACIKHSQVMLKSLLNKAIKKTNQDHHQKLKPLCEQFVRWVLSKDKKKDKDKKKEKEKEKVKERERTIDDFRELFEDCDVSIENLYEWSMEPIKSQVQTAREMQIKKERTGWFSSNEAQLSPEEKKELQRVLNQLAEDSIGGNARPPQCTLLKLALRLKGIYFYFYDENPIQKLRTIELKIEDISCFLQKSHNNSFFSVENCIQKIVADLELQETKGITKIHLMENLGEQGKQPLLEMVFKQSVKVKKGKTQLSYFSDVNLGKAVFTYKKEYWKMFREFFSLPEIDQQVQNEAIGKFELLKGESSDEEQGVQIQKTYNIVLKLQSPSFILPLTQTSCWYLDLGRITMKSFSVGDHFSYPFKLRQLNMRYMDSYDPKRSSRLIHEQKTFFPIIKDINVDVNMVTSVSEGAMSFDVELQKIQLSATRQQFVNLLNVKKFLVGQQKDQIVVLQENRKQKEQVLQKSKLNAKLAKRGKYLHNWVDYCCYFSSNSVYFYPNEGQLVPDSILSLRGAKVTKKIHAVQNSTHYQLEISNSSQTTYLEFLSRQLLEQWQKQLSAAVHQLKDMDALMLGDEGKRKKRRQKKQDLLSVSLNLNKLSWDYLNSKGQSFMKIQLQNLSFRMRQKEDKIETVLSVGNLSIYDRVFEYNDKKYQHFLKSGDLTVKIEKERLKTTKISPVLIDAQLDTLDLNWKPDALLLLIQSLKEFMDIKPISKNKHKSRQQIIKQVQNDINIKAKHKKYQLEGANCTVKDKRDQYLRVHAKQDQVYIRVTTNIVSLGINFIHRQSHVPMFRLTGQQLATSVTLAQGQRYFEGYLSTLHLFEIFGYPQVKYNPNSDYQPFCLVQKQASCKQLKALKFVFSDYQPQDIPNKERVNSFLTLEFCPLTIHYFQEVTMRLIDYSLIQIILLLNNPDMITANEDVLQQLLKDNRKGIQNLRYFMQDDFQNVVQRFFHPLFMDYHIILDKPELILSPTKHSAQNFTVLSRQVVINNRQLKQSGRFQRTNYQFKDMTYEEQIFIKGQQLQLVSHNNKFVSPMLAEPFSCQAVVNRLVFEEEIIGISPELTGYDRTIRVDNHLSAIIIPQLSKILFENLVRLPNFNLTFEDRQEQLFIHNYKITKTLSPKPIAYSLNIDRLSATTLHSLDEDPSLKMKLFNLDFIKFSLSFKRDQKFNSNVDISIQEAACNQFLYEQFSRDRAPQVKTLAKINKSSKPHHCYFLIKLSNTGKIDIQGFIEECQLFINMGVLALITQWVLLDDSVFPSTAATTRPIYLVLRMPRIVAHLQNNTDYQSSLKTVGQLVLEVTRNKCQSESFLRQGLKNKSIQPDYVEQMREFMSVKVSLGVGFFNSFEGHDRKLLDKTGIEFRQLDYFKIRKDKLVRTMSRRLTMSDMRGSFSIDDIILFKSLGDTLSQGTRYQKQFKEFLQAEFGKLDLSTEVNMYRDVFKEEKLLEELSLKVQSIKFYLISKENAEYIPILRLYLQQLSVSLFVNANSTVVTGDLSLDINYFNDRIFRWEPLVEPFVMKWNVMSAENKEQDIQVQVLNTIFLNISSQNAVSVKKCLKVIGDKMELQQQGGYKPDLAQDFISRYIIKNETGHPLEVFDERGLSMYVIMQGEKIHYNSKAIMKSFFEQNQLQETIAFKILHPSQEFLPVSSISLENNKSFQIELYTRKGVKLPPNSWLFLQSSVEGSKKVITIASKKYIKDYTEGVLVKQYYPFDCDDTVALGGQHKGFKANFFKKNQSQRYLYHGSGGQLTVRKKYLVYNYTMIPLKVCDYLVVPGTFVGINGALTIQGQSYKDSPLRVVFEEKKGQYYIYSISYIIDYVGFQISFDESQENIKNYSHQFKERGRNFWIYLLPSINTEFTVKLGKHSSKELQGKLTKQIFQLTHNNAVHSFNCFGSLQTFCQNNIKDFRRVIQLTRGLTICNDTDEVITYKQCGSRERMIQLGPHQNKPFFWPQSGIKELLQIGVLSEKQQWNVSSPLPIDQSTQTFIIRSKTDERNYKILALQLQETNNMTFIHIVNGNHKIQILNSIPHSNLTLYQTVVFQNKNINLKQPQNYVYSMPYKVRKSFGYQLPRLSHEVTVQIQLQGTHYNWRCPSFSIPDIQNNLIERVIEIKVKQQTKKIGIALNFDRNTKTIEFSLKKSTIFNQVVESVVRCRLKGISLSLIGTYQTVRKEIINVSIGDIALNFYLNDKHFQTSFSAQFIRIENTLKADPYFVSLFRQAEKNNKPAIQFALKKSRTNPRLIYYIGFSLKKSVLTVTSEELQILEENVNGIMEELNEKSDTNVLLNLEQKFTPRKTRNDQKIYFTQAEIHPIRLTMTYKHVNNWGGALLKALSINQCKVKVDGKKFGNFVCHDLLDFTSKIGAHFKDGFQNQIFSMIGSLALLGSPLNLASKIGGGIANLVTLPADGFEDDGVLGVGKGLAMGAGSLVSNTVEGAFGTVESITGTIGNGVSGLASYDKNFQRKRQELKNQRVDHVGEGLLSGGKSIANGFFTGITGLVTEPIKGAEKEGLGGFFMGGLKGITGLIVKPVSGVIDATSKTAEGIKNTTKVFSKQAKEQRIRRYNPRPFYNSCREIRNYDNVLAVWNKELSTLKDRYEVLSWVGLFQLRGGQLFIITYEYLLVLGRAQLVVKHEIASDSLLEMGKEGNNIIMLVKDEDNKRVKVTLDVKNQEECWGELKKLRQHYQLNYETGVELKTPK